ncbi:MAG TPA: hypothetical protein VF827_00980 [Syntrophales bacterium]
MTSGEPKERLGPRTSSTRYLIIILVIAFTLPIAANACPVCFGNPDSPMTKGTTNAIWFLLGLVGVVQAGFIALFYSFWRRAREAKKFREQFRLIEGGVE